MTFYWWSHWFWITLLGNLILLNNVTVHTYPSQESTLDYNSNQEENTKKLTTRLYQTSTITWATHSAAVNNGKITALEKVKLQHVKQAYEKSSTAAPSAQTKEAGHVNRNAEEDYYYDYDATEENQEKLNLEGMEKDLERKEKKYSHTVDEQQHELDVKRSAEDVQNKTATPINDETKLLNVSSTTTRVEEPNNYTNFSDKLHSKTSTNITAAAVEGAGAGEGEREREAAARENTTSTTNNTNSDNTIKNTTTPTTTSNLTTQLPQVPSTPRIVVVKSQTGPSDWLNTVAAQITPSHVTTDVTQDTKGEPAHKIPYTLENVNKPEDLRREETEHRTRKSKGLSADYKVNHYINYSSESKNLLTRSAATTVNENDSEESNISSEALSVQRAYFMDVGAISAICFTVFGICCTVGTVGIVLYRRRFLNKPQALSEPDSSVYIDDSTMRVSDNSDEMYSLDNDSFLNSLEAMTIQNYWTDTVKHTKL